MKALFDKFLYSDAGTVIIAIVATAIIFPTIMFASAAMLSGALILH